MDDVLAQAADVAAAETEGEPQNGYKTVATAEVSRAQVACEAEALTAPEREVIHASLRTISGYCDGAQAVDGSGFSKVDAAIGKALATAPQLSARQAALGLRLCWRYRRQLPDIVVDQLAETRRRLAAVEIDPAKLEARRVNDNEPKVRQTAPMAIAI